MQVPRLPWAGEARGPGIKSLTGINRYWIPPKAFGGAEAAVQTRNRERLLLKLTVDFVGFVLMLPKAATKKPKGFVVLS